MTVPSKMPLPANSELDPNGIDAHARGAKLDAGKTQPELIFRGFARVLHQQRNKVGVPLFRSSLVPEGISSFVAERQFKSVTPIKRLFLYIKQ